MTDRLISSTGLTRSPSTRNITICISQAKPSWKRCRLYL